MATDFSGISPNLMQHLLGPSATENGAFASSGSPFSAVLIRPIRHDDLDLLQAMHQRLSTKTLYMRYHSPRRPTRAELNLICRLGGQKGQAIVAARPGKNPQILGLAYYVVSGPNTAEAAFLVEDRYQGQGLGQRLMKVLMQQARSQAIDYFEAIVLPANTAVFHLLNRSERVVGNKLGYGSREVRLEL